MNRYKQPDGTYELADWPARRRKGWLNLAWIVTHYCDLNCPYCIGWKKGADAPPTLIDVHGVDGCLDRFERMREASGREVYLTISGGEPTLASGIVELCAGLTRRGFMVELHTNLTTRIFPAWADAVDPKMVGQVMASFHGWKLGSDREVWERYHSNFDKASEMGLTPVAKRIVLPREVARVDQILADIKKGLPPDSPVLLWGYIKGRPASPLDSAGAYPYAYTDAQKEKLDAVRFYRRGCQKAYQSGAGFFQGMRCDAGLDFVYMDVQGDIWRCFTANRKEHSRVGRFEDASFGDASGPCPFPYCSTPFWGLWYGHNPWDYVPGLERRQCSFCRHGPGKAPKYPHEG